VSFQTLCYQGIRRSYSCNSILISISHGLDLSLVAEPVTRLNGVTLHCIRYGVIKLRNEIKCILSRDQRAPLQCTQINMDSSFGLIQYSRDI
jgi:hypothetical protein